MLQEMQATIQTTITMLAKTQVVQTQTTVSVEIKKRPKRSLFYVVENSVFSQLTVILDTRNIKEERSRRRT